MVSPFVSLLAIVQAPHFTLMLASAPDISSQFLTSVCLLGDFSQLPDRNFETVFATFVAAIAKGSLPHADAEEFLREYLMVSRSSCSDFLSCTCARLRKAACATQAVVEQLKTRLPPANDKAQEEFELELVEAEANASRMENELAKAKAQAKCADNDWSTAFEKLSYHPRLLRLISEAVKPSTSVSTTMSPTISMLAPICVLAQKPTTCMSVTHKRSNPLPEAPSKPAEEDIDEL